MIRNSTQRRGTRRSRVDPTGWSVKRYAGSRHSGPECAQKRTGGTQTRSWPRQASCHPAPPAAPGPKKNTGRVHPPGSYWKNTIRTWDRQAGICPLFLAIAQSDNRSVGLCRRPRRAWPTACARPRSAVPLLLGDSSCDQLAMRTRRGCPARCSGCLNRGGGQRARQAARTR